MPFKCPIFDKLSNTVQSVTEKQIETMYQKDEFYYTENNYLQLLEMEYAEESPYRFGVILPKNLSYPQFPEEDEFNVLIKNLKKEDVKVYLPKFRKESTIGLIPYLEGLGIKRLFREFQAEFGNMNFGDVISDSFVSDIIQKAVIIVDEEGTEAAAATAVIVLQNFSIKPQKEIIFKVDHPFNYYIRDSQTNVLYFVGTFLS